MKDMKKTLLRAGICLSLLLGVFATDAGAQTVDYSLAKVEMYQGLYCFTDCAPVAAYEYLGTVKSNTGGFGSSQYSEVKERLVKNLKKEFPQADGIIIYCKTGQADKADAIKFK